MTQTFTTMLNGIDKHDFLAFLAKRIAFHLLLLSMMLFVGVPYMAFTSYVNAFLSSVLLFLSLYCVCV